jgi:hypothetical protein
MNGTIKLIKYYKSGVFNLFWAYSYQERHMTVLIRVCQQEETNGSGIISIDAGIDRWLLVHHHSLLCPSFSKAYNRRVISLPEFFQFL